MTTIATDGRTIAADSRMVCEDRIASDLQPKLDPLSDGSWLGCMGNPLDSRRVRSAIESELAVGKIWPFDIKIDGLCKDFLGLLVDSKNRVWLVGDDGGVDRATVPAAIGSGGAIAQGAMMAGASPSEAVKIAIALDPFSGGEIVVRAPGNPMAIEFHGCTFQAGSSSIDTSPDRPGE